MSGKRGRTNKVTLGMLKGKAITTSVPSIAVRFHSGDEELDIYPSADDEDDGDKDDVKSTSSATAIISSCTPSNASSSVQSCEPSPMKEYLKGLGKRSTSVDAGMMDAGGSSGDTWRIFHELKGKITKTVEEKLTEIKSERRSGTPLFSGKSSPGHSRLRAGGNSQDNSSISDSEDISENSNKDESRASQTSESATAPQQQKHAQTKQDNVQQPVKGEVKEMPSTAMDEFAVDESTKKKGKKEQKTGLRHRKGTDRVVVTFDEDTDDSCNKALLEEDIESGVEVSEETKFASDTILFENISTIDYRISPPKAYSPPLIPVRRKSTYTGLAEPQGPFYILQQKLLQYYKVIFLIFVFLIVFIIPLPPYLSGIIVGIFISMFYHLIVGMRYWYLPAGIFSEPFTRVPDYMKMPILEVPSVDQVETITKYGGWMNELSETYDPDTYHINNTHSVYVRLEGSILRLSHPKAKVPKRALWNERKLKLKFLHQRIYDISGCSIKLLPEGITRKRRWSKKYPICIMLKKESKKSQVLIGLPIKPSDLPNEVSSESIFSECLHDDTSSLIVVQEDESTDTMFLSEDTISLSSRAEKDSLDLMEESESGIDFIVQCKPSRFVAEDCEQLETMLEASDDDTFCIIDEPLEQESCLYLFSRTDRQKEDWYRKFVEAVKGVINEKNKELEEEGFVQQNITGLLSEAAAEMSVKHGSTDNSQDTLSDNDVDFVLPSALHNADMDYITFMNKFNLKSNRDKKSERVAGSMKLDREVECDVMWINAMVGRILYDVLQNPIWIEKIEAKIQKKLATVKLPFFVEELTLISTEFGHDIPMIHRVSRPVLDDHGLWVDLDVTYEGHAVVTLETKLNLMKLKKMSVNANTIDSIDEAAQLPDVEGTPEKTPEKCKSPIYDSSVEDSAESSPTESDEEAVVSSSEEDLKTNTSNMSTSVTPPDEAAGSSLPPVPLTSQEKKKAPLAGPGKGVLKMMNKFVASHFFQTATENKYIKRAMEGVSNTQITLTVEIRACSGQLAVNLPPPPSDRLWYGFRGNPRLWISVKPKFGQRPVNISYVISWLEKKLLLEFEKKFVLPNMDDLVIPPMTTELPE